MSNSLFQIHITENVSMSALAGIFISLIHYLFDKEKLVKLLFELDEPIN